MASLESSKGLGQKSGNYLTYTAPQGYFIYSMKIEANTNSTKERIVKFAGITILTSSSTTLSKGEEVLFTNNITTGTFSVNDGTTYISKLEVVLKPLPN